MPSTYEVIATSTLTSSASTVTFSSISSAYTDIVAICSTTNTVSACNFAFRLNGDTTATYSRTRITGNGTSATSGTSGASTNTYLYFGDVGNPNVPAVAQVHLMNYSNTTTYKTAIGLSGEADIQTNGIVGIWRNTSAVNSITFLPDANSFASGSTFTLYGIKAA